MSQFKEKGKQIVHENLVFLREVIFLWVI